MLVRTLPRLSILLIVWAVVGLCALPVQAQERSEALPRVSSNASISQTVGITNIGITYGRPAVRGRTIFGDLVPYGDVWRTGANEATTISFSTPVEIEGQPLDAGTYALFTRPAQDTWEIIFNSEANQWGAYNMDDSQNVLRVEANPEAAPQREFLTFNFENVTDTSATIALYWADTRVPFTVTTDTPEHVRRQANTASAQASDWREPYQYARYAMTEGVFEQEAMAWIDRSIELERTYANLALKARLLADREDYVQAVEVANEALSMAESMEEPPNGMEDLQTLVQEWQAKTS